MQVNGQLAAESVDKKNGLPASTEIILNETFRDFFGAKYVQIGQGGKATFSVQCLSCKRLFFDLGSSIATIEEGFSSLVLVEEVL